MKLGITEDDLRKTIEQILEGKSASASGGGGPIYLIFGIDSDCAG